MWDGNDRNYYIVDCVLEMVDKYERSLYMKVCLLLHDIIKNA